jgi:hypothetical protein
MKTREPRADCVSIASAERSSLLLAGRQFLQQPELMLLD